jgi:hypothetical protein
MHQNMAFGAKVVFENMQLNFSRNVGETEQYLLRHLHYARSLCALHKLVGSIAMLANVCPWIISQSLINLTILSLIVPQKPTVLQLVQIL